MHDTSIICNKNTVCSLLPFLQLFNSHGSGYRGFGKDATEGDGRRFLGTQSNQSVRNAIQGALASVSGGPEKLDVVGFDACLMQDFSALGSYSSVAKYFLASEDVVPGHGE